MLLVCASFEVSWDQQARIRALPDFLGRVALPHPRVALCQEPVIIRPGQRARVQEDVGFVFAGLGGEAGEQQ